KPIDAIGALTQAPSLMDRLRRDRLGLGNAEPVGLELEAVARPHDPLPRLVRAQEADTDVEVLEAEPCLALPNLGGNLGQEMLAEHDRHWPVPVNLPVRFPAGVDSAHHAVLLDMCERRRLIELFVVDLDA